MDEITIKIDDVEVKCLPDDTIMKAARRAGIYIPGICYSEGTEYTNCCRLCMVMVKDKMVAACALKVKEGMEVITDNEEKLNKVRATIIRLMHSEAPDSQYVNDLMERYGVEPEPAFPNKEGECILCGKCVQACKALGNSAISTVYRGVIKKIATPFDNPSTSCIGCASCYDVCPTHTIFKKDTEKGRQIWNKNFDWIHCQECGAIISTIEHYNVVKARTIDELVKEERDVGGAYEKILCPDCRRRHITKVFESSLGELD